MMWVIQAYTYFCLLYSGACLMPKVLLNARHELRHQPSLMVLRMKDKNVKDGVGQRRKFVITSATTTFFLVSPFLIIAKAAEDESIDFAAIADRASKISQQLEINSSECNDATAAFTKPSSVTSEKSIYDFSLPREGKLVAFHDLIQQEIREDDRAKVKAIVVVNIKQDDPVARKMIPELISLAAKYGRGNDGSLAVVACPTDQGYYEPDTSVLIRLKLASEYGFGINPSTILTDKVNLLGSGAHPFWRWLEGTCRTPSGLGRIEGNFEKFLVDGRTGQPVRRYPRKYQPLNMAGDIEALIAGRPLPPAQANFQEEWRSAAVESERDTYRFEKGLNYFDQ